MPDSIRSVDPSLAQAIAQEERRQKDHLELIASENFVHPAVLAAAGSVLTNKYAEGYPGRRYYGGCAHVDVVEQLAIDRLKQLFSAEHANVQPHSGAQANMSVFLATLKPGDTIMGMDLSHGGHLTHGHPLNFSGITYKVVSYGVRQDDETIDYSELQSKARECRPRMIIAGASAYPRIIDFAAIAAIAREVDALFMVDMAHIAGLVAAGLHPSPLPHADIVTSTTHKTLRGPRGGVILCKERLAKDIDRAVFPGVQGGPLMHIIAAKAVAFGLALRPSFVAYQRRVLENARVLAEALAQHGFRIVSGGTDNHLMLVDTYRKGITGRDAEKRLDLVGITVNKNTIPFDSNKPMVASGIRIGTPAMTTRGMGPAEMQQIATWVDQALALPESAQEELQALRQRVGAFAETFPLHAQEE
jgi:glycine hydroxymethyltransferase